MTKNLEELIFWNMFLKEMVNKYQGYIFRFNLNYHDLNNQPILLMCILRRK